jgi:two-component system osmolarity sensor histidine kinase EnvZ
MVRLRDYTPRGYNARHIVILILPMLVFVIAMTLFFFNSHVQSVNTQLSRSAAQLIRAAVDQRRTSPESWDAFAANIRNAGFMNLEFIPGVALIDRQPAGGHCCAELQNELAVALAQPFNYAIDQKAGMITLVTTAEGGLLEATFDRKRVMIITAHIFIVWSVGFSVLLLATSYAFLRNQVRSILQLSTAAEAFGRGEDQPDFKPSGAREVRYAARSLIRMRNRLRRYADQRTAMLAGVSHDLRTPLTRLKLELAMAPKDFDTRAARADIGEMERMLDGYLAFARGEEGEQAVEADLVTVVREAAASAASRARIDFVAPAPVPLRFRQLAMKRAIANLANNAADYGKAVRITVRSELGSAVIIVEDDGPGIPTAMYEEAFKPFSRLDAARNQNVSGVGLGLTIARDTARAHGGDVTLGKSELGGLRAQIRLPLSPVEQRDPKD